MPVWTRKRTFEPEHDDWVVLRDGFVVGRVMRDTQQRSRVGREQWMWNVLTMPAHNGWADTLEEALEQVRELASDRWGHKPHGWPDDR